jgi:hypothetical protein
MSSAVEHFGECPNLVSEELSELLAARLPRRYSGRLYFIVTANIQLVKRTARNGSIPGAPLQTFRQPRVNRLDEAELPLVPGE